MNAFVGYPQFVRAFSRIRNSVEEATEGLSQICTLYAIRTAHCIDGNSCPKGLGAETDVTFGWPEEP